jgi:hypothetical protein
VPLSDRDSGHEGPGDQMIPNIKEWETNPPEGAPKLLFVLAGTEEANRDMGVGSTVVLDQQFAVGRAFGATGTPSAVLVDADGQVASEVAVGAPAVLELAKRGKRRGGVIPPLETGCRARDHRGNSQGVG